VEQGEGEGGRGGLGGWTICDWGAVGWGEERGWSFGLHVYMCISTVVRLGMDLGLSTGELKFSILTLLGEHGEVFVD